MSDPELTPAQTESVRALLASARHDEPVPDHVAARLDATLAQLRDAGVSSVASSVASSPVVGDPAPVIDLASRRRRRVAGALVAAAAVVTLGVALPQALPRGGNDSGTAAQTAESSAAGQDRTFAEDSPSAGSRLRSNPLRKDEPAPAQSGPLAVAVPALTSGPGLAERVVALRDQAGRGPAPCAAGRTPRRWLEVTLDGAPATLVFRPARGATQRVEVVPCDAGGSPYVLDVPAG